MSIQQRSTVTSVSLGCRMKLIKGRRSKNNSPKHCASSHHGVVSSKRNKRTVGLTVTRVSHSPVSSLVSVEQQKQIVFKGNKGTLISRSLESPAFFFFFF